jgi:RND superfamily putative drug exporter
MNSTAVADDVQPSTTPSKRSAPGPGDVAGWCYDHRRAVLGGWILALVLITVISQGIGSSYQDKLGGGDNTQSGRAQTLLKERFPAQAGDNANVVFSTATPITDPTNQQRITTLVSKLQSLPHVRGVRSPVGPAGIGLSSTTDPHIAYAVVQFDAQTQDLSKPSIQRVVDTAEAARGKGFDVQLGGQPISKVVVATPGSSEGIGIGAAIIILLVAFGSVIAMGLPIATALIGIGIGVGIQTLLSHAITTPTFSPELAAMIGIGVGIDYALFIVTRYRQGLAEGRDPRGAVVRALDTSGRAVTFAGTTVVISLFGMLLLGESFVYGLAAGAIAAVLVVMLASLTLLPALLGFVGTGIDRLRIPGLHSNAGASDDQEGSIWYRWSREVQRRPWVTASFALVVLVVLAIPLFSLQMLFSDSGNDPTSLTTRHAYDLIAKGFGPGANGPLVIAVDIGPGTTAQLNGLYTTIQKAPNVKFVVPPQVNAQKNAATIIVIPGTSPQSTKTETLVKELRSRYIPAATSGTGMHALVGGVTAAGIDTAAQFSSRLYLVIGLVVLLSFILLMAVFRSLAVPLKAAIMNLLSIGAAYGVIVAIFQWGWLRSAIGVDKTGPIDPWIPLMLFTILFGLSMDYEVFLLSRIREEFVRTGDNKTSVADGLAQTGRVITAAAAIMFCVFGSFVVGDLRVLKVFGLGLAVAVLVDATIVRMVLVPSTMELLGKANWWLPKWLDRIVPRLDVEGKPDDFTPSAASPR